MLWSLFSVPIMTVLVGNMGDTVVDEFKRVSSGLADFTVLPKAGVWGNWMRLAGQWVESTKAKYLGEKREGRMRERFSSSSREEDTDPETGTGGVGASGEEQQEVNPCDPCTVPENEKPHNPDEDAILTSLARDAENDAEDEAANLTPSPSMLSRALATTIQLVVGDLRLATPKRYSYEEWVEFRRLLRLSGKRTQEHERGEDEKDDDGGFFEWDWIGEDSPLISDMSESQWVLDRLCEALVRVEVGKGKQKRERKGKEKMRGGAGDGQDDNSGERRASSVDDSAVGSGLCPPSTSESSREKRPRT